MFEAARIMEFPEPYHSLPIHEWRKYMKAHPNSYATRSVRTWLRDRHKWRLVCYEKPPKQSLKDAYNATDQLSVTTAEYQRTFNSGAPFPA
jgi:hypothetical protein